MPSTTNDNTRYPVHIFRFQVDFQTDPLKPTGAGTPISLCSGAFADCTGLEATMEPKVIREGGRNYGAAQRVGPVTFGTVILKRGMTSSRDLWKWFELVSTGGYAYRLAAIVTLFNTAGESVLAWKLQKALPVKFKAADLSAKGSDIGIEELHLAHEGLTLVDPMQEKLYA